jgi:hypothetical protein
MVPPTSNIRVFVQWSQQTVFAGEEIECQITFKNVAPVNGSPKPAPHSSSLNGFAPGEERQRKTTPLQASAAQTSRNNAAIKSKATPASRGHRASFSLSGPTSDVRLPAQIPGPKRTESEVGTEGRSHSHRRSVSIISLGITEGGGDEPVSQRSFGDGPRRPARGHTRASSLQIVPRRQDLNGTGPPSGKFCLSLLELNSV